MLYDLHVHTNKSDGELSPEEVIGKAVEEGIKVISITDHDTLNAYDSLNENVPEGIKLITGIELSTIDYRYGVKSPVHIVGYNIDLNDEGLKSYFSKMELTRIKEIKAVIKILGSQVDERISLPNIMRFRKKITMNSVADYMCEIGIVDSREEAYRDFLTDGQIAFVQKECITPEEAISMVLKAGGIPVLAHPNRMKIPHLNCLEFIRDLAECGLAAVEVYCLKMSEDELKDYVDLCNELGLKLSAGSDFHKTVDKMGEWKLGAKIDTDLCDEGNLLVDVM